MVGRCRQRSYTRETLRESSNLMLTVAGDRLLPRPGHLRALPQGRGAALGRGEILPRNFSLPNIFMSFLQYGSAFCSAYFSQLFCCCPPSSTMHHSFLCAHSLYRSVFSDHHNLNNRSSWELLVLIPEMISDPLK